MCLFVHLLQIVVNVRLIKDRCEILVYILFVPNTVRNLTSYLLCYLPLSAYTYFIIDTLIIDAFTECLFVVFGSKFNVTFSLIKIDLLKIGIWNLSFDKDQALLL